MRSGIRCVDLECSPTDWSNCQFDLPPLPKASSHESIPTAHTPDLLRPAKLLVCQAAGIPRTSNRFAFAEHLLTRRSFTRGAGPDDLGVLNRIELLTASVRTPQQLRHHVDYRLKSGLRWQRVHSQCRRVAGILRDRACAHMAHRPGVPNAALRTC